MHWKALTLAAVVILAAGCGGGGNKSATTNTQAAAAKAQTAAAKAAAAAAAAAAKATTTASGLSGLATTANCRQLADLSAEYAQALQGTTSNIKKTSAVLKQFADKTPSDIRPAFETVAADYGKIADALRGVNVKQGSVPSPAVIAKLSKLGTEIDSAGLAKAETNIATWAQKNCVAK